MRVRSWASIGLVVAGTLLLTSSVFSDDRYRASEILSPPNDSWLADAAPRNGEPCSNPTPCCDLETCCDCYRPLWTVEAGALFLRRDNQTNIPLANGANPINVADLAFQDYQGGPLVTVMRHGLGGTITSLEVTYFGLQDTNTATTTGATAVFSVPTINFGANAVAADYRSRLDSTEINLRDTWTDWLIFLGGFRCVELSDDLATNIGGLATYDINVNNHLYGAQIGAEVVIWHRDRFSIDWFGKAGIYGNSADQSTTTTGVGGAVPRLSARSSQTAFLGEMDLSLRYEITEHWSVLGGYRAIWLDGIALAPNQPAVSNIATGAATLDNHGQPIYHGFTVAAQLVW